MLDSVAPWVWGALAAGVTGAVLIVATDLSDGLEIAIVVFVAALVTGVSGWARHGGNS